jgi:hypothetical protein
MPLARAILHMAADAPIQGDLLSRAKREFMQQEINI